MEQLKEIIKNKYELLIMTACVLFVIGVFFFSAKEGGIGVFATVGDSVFFMLKEQELVNEGVQHLQNSGGGYVPIVKFEAGPQKVGDCVELKSLLLVRQENGVYVSGKEEDGFAIYLTDVFSESGNSVLQVMSSEEFTHMEEIPVDFVYDKEKDLLYILGSGVYSVSIKIYADNGGMETYEFQLPVETS